MLQFPNLKLFQKWVGDGVIELEDEISRNGNRWRAIGTIPELVGLFEEILATRQLHDLAGALAISPTAEVAPTPPPLPDPEPPELPPEEPPPPQTEAKNETEPSPAPELAPAPPIAELAPAPPPPIAEPEPLPPPLPDIAEDDPDVTAPDLTFPDEPVAPTEVEAPPPPVVLEAPPAAADVPTLPWLDEPGVPEPAPPAAPAPADVTTQEELPQISEPASFEPKSTFDDWSPSFDDLSSFEEDALPAEPPPPPPVRAEPTPNVAGMDDPDMVSTMQDFKLPPSNEPMPADTTLSLEEEMDLAGSTLELKLPDQFELGRSIERDMGGPAEAGAHDPFALTMPEFKLPGSDPPDIPPPAAIDGPELDPDKHLQPVKAMKRMSAPAAKSPSVEVPLTADETEDLKSGRAFRIGVMLLLLAGLAAGGVVAWMQLATIEPTWPSAIASAAEVAGEPAPQAPAELGEAAEPAAAGGTTTAQAPEATAAGTAGAIGADAIGGGTDGAETASEEDGGTETELAPQLAEAEVARPRVELERPKRPQRPKRNTEKRNPRGERNKNRQKPKEETPPDPPPNTQSDPGEGADSYDGLMRRARSALRGGKPQQALTLLRQAAKMNPRSVEPIAKMGWAYLRMGNATEAILKFQEAKSRNPGYRDTYIGLAKAMERAGRVQDAITVYRQYLRMCPNCRKAAGVRASLMRLGAEP